jgi:precorrin-6B methylase 1
VLVQDVLRNSNGLNMMTLQMGVILSGDPRFYGAIRTVQDEFNQILPSLASPLN